MLTLLSRNLVKDYAEWKRIFDAQESAAREAGLELTQLCRDLEDPNNVFFTFRVADLERAKAFLSDPNSAEVGRRAGVVDGEYHFLESEDV